MITKILGKGKKIVGSLPILFRLFTQRPVTKFAMLDKLDGDVHRTCSVCGYVGRFKAFGIQPRFDSLCPKCHSLERQRLLILLNNQYGFIQKNTEVLHFAPEAIITDYVKKQGCNYRSADLCGTGEVLQENIENLSFSENQFQTIICSHVLEHVNDKKALSEMFRVLVPGGQLLLMIPVAEGWSNTYEDETITTPEERTLHFGNHDHLRIYGRDIRDRIQAAGFQLKEYTATGPQTVKYSLLPGETLFHCQKPNK
jgi:predicted SAM-dependent methyltransferase